MSEKKIIDTKKVEDNNKAKPKNIEKKEGLTVEEAKNLLISFREHVKSEFERFGFKETRNDKNGWVKWEHDGKKFNSTITIIQNTNSLILDQQEFRINSTPDDGEGEEGKWHRTGFGVMAPLYEVISKARDAYFISLNTRALNDRWTHSNIIPGTNGDGK